MSDGLRIEMMFTSPTWTPVMGPDVLYPDVIDDEGISFSLGISGNGPNDNTSDPGTLTFSLANGPDNSGGLLGYYSPFHANCREGFGRGTPVRVVYELDSVDQVLWTGKLASIDPVPGTAGMKRTRCRAVSKFDDLLQKIREIPPQIDRTEVECYQAIFDALPVNVQPSSFASDPALDVFAFPLVDLKDGITALSACKKVTDSCRGYFVERGDGTPRYRSRVFHALPVHRFVYTDEHLNPETGITRPTSIEDGRVFNLVRMSAHDVQLGATDTEVLFSHGAKLELAPGEIVEFFVPYQDQQNPDYKLGGTDFQDPPLSGTDYEFNAAENGSGADVTGDVDVTYDFFTSTCKVTLENTGAVTAYKQVLQGRGRAIRDFGPIWSESFVQKDYGVRDIEIDQPYQNDQRVAADQAAYTRAGYQDEEDQIDGIEFLANQSDEVLREAILTELLDVVRVSEEVTGTILVDGYVQWKEWTVEPGGLITVRYTLAPRIENEENQGEDLEVSDNLGVVVAAPESRVGYALVNMSEVA